MINQFTNSAENNLTKITINQKEVSSRNWTIWHIGAGFGLLFGTFILASSVFLTLFQFLYGEQQHGNWLFAVALLLWVIGAHCFDKVEEINKVRVIEYCKRHSMTDEECTRQKLKGETFK